MPSQGPQSRRPVDVVVVVVGLLVTAVSARLSGGRSGLEGSLLAVPDNLPPGVTAVFDATYALGAAYAIGIAAAVLVTAARRGRLPLVILAAAGLALAATVLVSALVGDGWPDFAPDHAAALEGHTFPTVRIAIVAAVLLVVRPWIVLTYRRFNVAVVAVLCIAAWAIGIAGPPDVLGALGVGLTAAGVVLVALGSPGGHPTVGRVTDNLRALGVDIDELEFAPRQPWGVRILHGTTTTGERLLVKVYGRDAADAHRAARWWRALLYRDQTAPDATELQLVEHEALVTILSERAGVRVTTVVSAASVQGDAVLVLREPPVALVPETHGQSVDRPQPPPAVLSDEVLAVCWRAVARLRSAGLCHGALTLDKIALDEDGEPVLLDFSAGSLAATPAQQAIDVATLLTAQARRSGPDRAVAAALEQLGAQALVEAQPYLQGAALPRTLRAEPGVKQTLGELRRQIAERTGTEPPPPAPIRRVSWRDVVQTVLLVVAAYALLTMLGQLDWATVFDTWANATWGWIVLGVVIAQATSVVDALSTMATVTSRLPLIPLVQLQYAIKLVGLAVSATAGRAAMNASFFKRFGEGPSAAVTATALDSFAGAVCNAVVVVLALLLVDQPPDIPLEGPDNLTGLIVLLVVGVVACVVAVLLVPRLRRAAASAARGLTESVRVVTRSPARGLLLFGSNLASLLITAVAMDCMVEGLYPPLDYATVLAVTAGAALFSAVIPVPGNVGVAEAAITTGLVLVGLPSGPAFAIAVTQRIATSYLPPIFGAWSLRWLRKEDYVG